MSKKTTWTLFSVSSYPTISHKPFAVYHMHLFSRMVAKNFLRQMDREACIYFPHVNLITGFSSVQSPWCS